MIRPSVKREPLPEKVDIRIEGEVGEQGELASSTAFAVSSLFNGKEHEDEKDEQSKLFVYYTSRSID